MMNPNGGMGRGRGGGGGRGRGGQQMGGPPMGQMPMGGGPPNDDMRPSLRRPNANTSQPPLATEELVNGMNNMNPFRQGDFGAFRNNPPPVFIPPVPAPNADGWSSGENLYENGVYWGGGGGGGGGGMGGFGPGGGGGGREQFADASADRFNVRAPEFVPKSNLSVSAQEFVPRNMARNTSTWAYEQQQAQVSQLDAIESLNDAIATLQFKPAKVEYFPQYLAQQFNTNITDLGTLKQIVGHIIEKCISDANFRPTGAKMCDKLAFYCVVEIDGINFRQILLEQCRDEHTAHSSGAISDPARLRAFTSLISEFFLHLGVYGADGVTKQRITVLANALVELLTTLTQTREHENLKTLDQILRASGCILEEEDKLTNSGSAPSVDQLFSVISTTASEESLPDPLKQLLNGLVELRSQGWPGCMTSEQMASAAATAASQSSSSSSSQPTRQPARLEYPPEMQQQQQQQQQWGRNNYRSNNQRNNRTNASQQQTVMVDGNELTMDEYQFMQEALGEVGAGPTEPDSDLESAGGGDVMPDDIEAAFEEFLISQKNEKNQ